MKVVPIYVQKQYLNHQIILCYTSLSQTSVFEEQLEKLSNSNLDKTILNMITLQEFTEVDFDNIVALTQQAKQDEVDQLENYYKQFLIDSYSTQVTEYSIEVAQLQSYITALQKQAGNAIRLLYSLREDFVTSTINLKGNKHSLEETINLLDTEIIPQLKVEIETKDGEINTKQRILSGTQANLHITQINLDNINTGQATRILSYAECAFQRGGIRR